MFGLQNVPMYDPEAVKPMREELTRAGLGELLTPADVDGSVAKGKGTVLVVVNSVCGCAAGILRPAVVRAVARRPAPDRSVTVFAGMERDAVERVRALAPGVPPSSPSVYLFRDGAPVDGLQRSDIEGRTAGMIESSLAAMFARHCVATPAAPAIAGDARG